MNSHYRLVVDSLFAQTGDGFVCRGQFVRGVSENDSSKGAL